MLVHGRGQRIHLYSINPGHSLLRWSFFSLGSKFHHFCWSRSQFLDVSPESSLFLNAKYLIYLVTSGFNGFGWGLGWRLFQLTWINISILEVMCHFTVFFWGVYNHSFNIIRAYGQQLLNCIQISAIIYLVILLSLWIWDIYAKLLDRSRVFQKCVAPFMGFPPVVWTVWLSPIGKVAVICVAIVLVQLIVFMVLRTFLLSQEFGLWLNLNNVPLESLANLVNRLLKLVNLLENKIKFFIFKKSNIVLCSKNFSISNPLFLFVFLLSILQERLLFALIIFTAHLKLPLDSNLINTKFSLCVSL